MSQIPCFETICFDGNQFQNLAYHQARLDRTRENLYGLEPDWQLSNVLKIPDNLDDIKYKCRLTYTDQPGKIEWSPYTQRTVSKIKKVYSDNIDYTFKYDNRDELNALYAQKEDADEILIIRKSMVTDSAFCNIALFDGSNWYTPSNPLLLGTQRSFLLDTGIISERNIFENELNNYSHIRIFNAMISWDVAPEVATSMIV